MTNIENERETICQRIITILDLDCDNSFYIHELDNDIEKQEQLLELNDRLHKYSTVVGNTKHILEYNRPYLSNSMSILRQQKYNVVFFDTWLKCANGNKQKSIKYRISL
jgi:hypothetical protein